MRIRQIAVTRRIGVAWVMAVALGAAPADAQQLEVAFGSGLSSGPGDATYASSYEPLFPNVEHTGLATQTLAVEKKRTPVFWAAIDWLATPHAGLEVRVDYRRAPLGGSNEPYRVALSYIARHPPDFIPREFGFERSDEWPDTDGHLDQITAAAGLLVHAGRPEGAGVRLFIGAGLTNVRGTLQPLGYTSFLLGGHSVLFSEDMQVTARLESTTTVGVGTGGEVHVPLGGHVALTAGLRLFVPRAVDVRVAPTGLVEGSAALRDVPVEELERTLHPVPLHIRPVTLDFTIGLRVRL